MTLCSLPSIANSPPRRRAPLFSPQRTLLPPPPPKVGVLKEGRKERKMVVRIRLSRWGCSNRPFYRVIAANSRSPRDGKHLDVLGYYNPLPGMDGGKRMGLNFDRVKYWLSVGAQPSDPVQRILFRAGLLPPPPMTAMARKGGSRDACLVNPISGQMMAPSSSPVFTDEANNLEVESLK